MRATLLLLAALLFTVPVAAGAANIGFVNVAHIMQQAPQAKTAKARLEREFSKKDEQLADLEDEIRNLEGKLRRHARKMSEDKRERLERDILSKKRKFKSQREDFREQFNGRRNEELSRLQEAVYEIITSIAKTRKIDLIISEPVLYASDQINLTEDVIKALERQNSKQ